jgi:hypothetical protein
VRNPLPTPIPSRPVRSLMDRPIATWNEAEVAAFRTMYPAESPERIQFENAHNTDLGRLSLAEILDDIRYLDFLDSEDARKGGSTRDP